MLIFLCLLLALGLGGYNWYMRHATFADVQGGGFSLPASEVEAVGELLADAGLAPQRVRVVETSPEQPCWSYDHWTRLDTWLRVYRRFGRYPGTTNCIGIDRGHVVSLALVDTELADLYPLAHLPDLRSLYLTGNRIEHLDHVPKPCRWTKLSLASNGLIDCAALADCTHLETLDVSHNKLTTLPLLEALERLEKLDASNNEIERATGLAGLPSLAHLNLYGNRLTTLDAITNLPRLAYLNVAGNMLDSLDGLRDLPALRHLDAGSNRLAAIDADALAAFPGVRKVALYGNNIRAVPAGFVYDARTALLRPEGGGWPELDLRQNPVAETLEADAVAQHDATAIHQVAELPWGSGRFQGSTRRGRERRGALSSGVDVSGTAAWFEGAQSISFDLNHGVVVTATASVEQGRLRLYLEDPEGGYRYAEAIPGKPLRISGSLISMGRGYFIYLESVGGRVEGLRWTVSG